MHDTVPDLHTDLPFDVCLLLFVSVGLVFDECEALVVVLVVEVGVVDTQELAGTTVVFTVELVCVLPFESIEITSDSITDVIELHDVVDLRGACVVVLTVDVGVVETHELAGTTVVFFVVLVCVLPFESIEITSDSITDVIELHDVVDFFDGFTVDFFVVVGVVETHELAGTTVVFFVVLVCVLPFESTEITSDSITDVIELHDVVDFFDGFTVDFVVEVGVVETHELAGTTVVFFVVLVCLRPFESVEITSDSITDVIELHDVVDFFDGFTVDFFVVVGVVETHELAGTTVVFFVVLVCLRPFESVEITSDSITDVIELHDLLGFGVVFERHELSSTIVVTVVRLVCTLPLLSVDSIVDAITDGTELHDFLGLGPNCTRVVERTVDVRTGESHELAGTFVVNVDVVVCVLPRESTDFRIDLITSVEVLHGNENFGLPCDLNDRWSTVDLIVDVGVVVTHELAGTAVV